MELKQCPCGEVPEKLFVEKDPLSPHLATASPSCCGKWLVELSLPFYRTGTFDELAVEVWNDAPRFFEEED